MRSCIFGRFSIKLVKMSDHGRTLNFRRYSLKIRAAKVRAKNASLRFLNTFNWLSRDLVLLYIQRCAENSHLMSICSKVESLLSLSFPLDLAKSVWLRMFDALERRDLVRGCLVFRHLSFVYIIISRLRFYHGWQQLILVLCLWRNS